MQEVIAKALEGARPADGGRAARDPRAEGFPLWKAAACSPTGGRSSGWAAGICAWTRRWTGTRACRRRYCGSFVTYCVVGLTADAEALDARKAELSTHIAEVSAAKLQVGAVASWRRWAPG